MMKLKTLLRYSPLIIAIFVAQFCFAQLPDGFDIKKAYNDAQAKGIPASDIEGYVQYLHNDHLSHKGTHSHKNNEVYDIGTIYKNYNGSEVFRPASPYSPQNAYCPNAGFEQGNFTNWTGGYGTVSTGPTSSGFPTYNQSSGAIASGAGNNVSLVNTLNYHTIMTTPATNSVFPNCVGWDSIAVKAVGTQTVSEIPVVNPLGGPASVRLNGALANYRASKLAYNMTLNPNNKNFTISYAIVLNTYSSPHMPYEQPYFSVRVTDQNGNAVPGCSQYTVSIHPDMTNPSSSMYDPSWTKSVSVPSFSGEEYFYRKWQTFAFDFSNYPAITSVKVEFYVGGCSQSGHWGYAYVDAECSQGGAVASFCAGSNTSVLTAPGGYTSYQWTGPSGPVSAANGGNTSTATITPVTAGQVFTCNVTAPNGCSSVFQTTISITTVSVTGMGSTPSCLNGNSGTANVNATGSSSGYTYQWLNSSGGTVGSSQTATGLSPGTYSVIVSSPLCGSATATVAVGVSAPTFYSLSAPYCGTTAWITNNGGSNYKWYTASPLALIPGATSSSLTINSPVNGAGYFLVYTTASGCKDSIRYTLTQQPGGNIYVSNIKSICPGNSNATAVINLVTNASPTYSYAVTGPSGYSAVSTNTTATTFSVSNLSLATYSVQVFDGLCLYNTTFSVTPFLFTYTLTPQTSTICSGGQTTLAVNFCNSSSSTQSCGIVAASTSTCSNPAQITLGNGIATNGTTTYPAPYGNFYESMHFQMLFTASELIGAGVQPGRLTSLAFNVANLNSLSQNLPNYTIKLKCTSATAANTFDMAGLTQVYTAPSLNVVTGWNTHVFQSAYYWSGTSNLLVDVCYTNTSDYEDNPSSPYTVTPFTSVVWYRTDGSNTCNVTTISGTSANRPNVKFGSLVGYSPTQFSYTWTPTAGLNPTTSYTTIANPTTTTVYTVQVEPVGQTNCMQMQTSTVTIINPATPTITPVSPLCTNASPLTLTVTPTGGTWLGSGVNAAGVLTPSLVTPGNNTYTYTIGSGSCSAVGNTTISVEQFIPATITGTINPICITDLPVNLSTLVTNTTGVWAGNGVTGNTFDPALAGAGTFTLVHSTNSSPTAALCPDDDSLVVTVISIAQPTITAVNPLCDNASPVVLNATPTGGVWSGQGVDPTGVFTPSLAVVGNNTYTYTVGTGTCSNTGNISISVEQFVPATITGTINPLCVTNPPINLVPLTTAATGTWSGTGVSGTVFDPSLATAGTYSIIHTTNSTSFLCQDTQTLIVSVSSVVQPTITAAGPYCDSFTPQTMTVDAAATGGVWSSPNSLTDISASGVFTPTTSLIGDNTIVYTLTNGPCVKTDTILVNVVKFVPADIMNGFGPFCYYDGAVNLQNAALNSGGIWTGSGVNGTVFTPSLATIGTNTITYTTDPAPAGLCPDVQSIVILVNATPTVSALGDRVESCNPLTVNYYTPANSGFGSWNFGDGELGSGLTVSHTYTTPGVYLATFIYTDNAGCKDTALAASSVTVYPVPVAAFEASPDITTVVDGQIEFTNNTSDLTNNTYTWDFGGLGFSTDVNPSYLFTVSGEFFVTLTASSVHNCTHTAVKKVTINPDVVLYVPNAFTPGGDGLNDQFQIFLPPTGVDFSTFNLTIFDRWGSVVYKTNDVNKFWTGARNNSGDIMKQDTYVYKISFMDEKKKYYEKLGYVTLLRK